MSQHALSPNKRGDHVFANGLRQTFNQLAKSIDEKLDNGPSKNRLLSVVDTCRAMLQRPVFDLVVRLPGPPRFFGDAHSIAYGKFQSRFLLEITSFLVYVRERDRTKTGPQVVVYFEELRRQAVQALDMTLSEWMRAAVDAKAEAVAKSAGAAQAIAIEQGKQGLESIRKSMLDALRKI